MGLRGRIGKLPATVNERAGIWLRQGISPRRLALTLALGFAIGCIPVVGIPTVLCAALAFAFRLNFPAIQAANYAAMPLQIVLIVPFMRMGRWLLSAHSAPTFQSDALFRVPIWHLATSIGSLAGQALLAWLLIAAPAVTLMTLALTRMFKRIPALRTASES